MSFENAWKLGAEHTHTHTCIVCIYTKSVCDETLASVYQADTNTHTHTHKLYAHRENRIIFFRFYKNASTTTNDGSVYTKCVLVDVRSCSCLDIGHTQTHLYRQESAVLQASEKKRVAVAGYAHEYERMCRKSVQNGV